MIGNVSCKEVVWFLLEKILFHDAQVAQTLNFIELKS